MICNVTLRDMIEKFEIHIMELTNMELAALQHLCEIYKEEEE
ncbi:unnamed protein product [marine sediment metagenome]|uniref:Uncharacterized protein n=1 Tax=marine sediment metagenome TaxID=412755 RepID=X1CCZ0_9ZZZZ